jgi:PilZ domain
MTYTTPPDARQRSERRIAVRLPVQVRGRDHRGLDFEETTSSQNLCRSGAAFRMHYDVDLGADLEILIPYLRPGAQPGLTNFATRGEVVHVTATDGGERLVGVRFTGPRFQRVFRPESGG